MGTQKSNEFLARINVTRTSEFIRFGVYEEYYMSFIMR